MAFRLKAEAGAIVALVVIAAGLRMWDPGFASRWGYTPGPDTIFRELTDAQTKYRSAYRVDSLYRALPESGAVLRAGDLAAEDSAAVAHAFTRDTAGSIEGVRSGMFVMGFSGSSYMPESLDSVQRLALIRAAGLGVRPYELFAGRDDEGAYCFAAVFGHGLNAVVREARRVEGTGRRWYGPPGSDTPLGPCRWWLRYGPPGPQLDAWLRAGRYGLADGEAWSLPDEPPDEEKIAFLHRDAWNSGSIPPMRCRAGDASACLQALEPAPNRPALMSAYARDWSGFIGSGEGAMFAHIEREFGAERFARFWRSDADVETAFASAFGVPFADWLQRWAQQHYGAVETGPGVDAVSVLLSLLTIAVLVWLGLRVVQQRSIG